jgi:hypothetical protein
MIDIPPIKQRQEILSLCVEVIIHHIKLMTNPTGCCKLDRSIRHLVSGCRVISNSGCLKDTVLEGCNLRFQSEDAVWKESQTSSVEDFTVLTMDNKLKLERRLKWYALDFQLELSTLVICPDNGRQITHGLNTTGLTG